MRVSWEQVQGDIAACQKCALCEGRTHVVPGEGNIHADIMLVGEGPGREEDRQGRPFVGPAGQLLDRMLQAIDIKRGEVYIANVVKCRPPQNRTPAEEEALCCLPYLRAQVALVHPKIIVCLGATAAKYVYDPSCRITRDRGVWKEKKGYWIIPTYHPAALLRDPEKKKDAWIDMQAIRDKRAELS